MTLQKLFKMNRFPTLFFIFGLIALLSVLNPKRSSADNLNLPDHAEYTVPTTADLVEHSRFKIEILKPYTGQSSSAISYVFPAELVGLENHIVNFTRVGNTNEWESPEMTASCMEIDNLFSCNIYLVKKPLPEATTLPLNSFVDMFSQNLSTASFSCSDNLHSFVNPNNVIQFLSASGFEGDVFDKKLAVAQAFSCSEPAGILFYEFPK